VIKVGEHLKSIKTEEIGYFFSRDKASYAMVGDRNYLLDFNMEQLVEVLDPNQFFRINRQYIVKIDAIKDIISYSNSRLRLVLENCDDNDVIVSRERVKLFKDWLDR
jgi:DNA-binding LytR/AlgR family response regulator